jgi:hypothetical protein
MLKSMLSAVGSSIGWGVLVVYLLWWMVAAAGVIAIVAVLLKTALGGWINASGWRQMYLSVGAITVLL